METIKQHALKIMIALAILLIAAVAGDFVMYQKSAAQHDSLSRNAAQITELQRKLESAIADNKSLKNQLAAKDAQCKAESEDLNAKLAAFAKQAASCEAIKKKLHLK